MALSVHKPSLCPAVLSDPAREPFAWLGLSTGNDSSLFHRPERQDLFQDRGSGSEQSVFIT